MRIKYFGDQNNPFATFDESIRETDIALRLNKTVRSVFTQGQCHALALAFNERYHYRIYGVFNPLYTLPTHVFVKAPQGYVDINGVGAECRARRWKRKIKPVKREDVLRYSYAGYLPPNIEVAKKFIPLVEKLIEKQTGGNNVREK